MAKQRMHVLSKLITWAGWGSVGLVVLLLCGHAVGLRWNFSESAPKGFYRRTSEPLARGTLVEFCLPERTARWAGARGYIRPARFWGQQCEHGYQSLLKPIAALPGDVVTLTPQGVWINGMHVSMSYSQPQDSRGRALVHWFPGETRLDLDYFWVMSTYAEMSLDSRYFGPIHKEWIRGTVRPWLVWPSTVEAGQ